MFALRKWRVVASVLLVLALLEVVTRLTGVTNFPTYKTDAQIGYFANPNQSGFFINRNRWVYNDRSMGIAEKWNPSLGINILLIGNSVVVGGNPQSQEHKLTELTQSAIGKKYSLWPIATGGWTNVNEIQFLEKNPDIERSSNLIIWEYMVGGASGLNSWKGDYVFPRTNPKWASFYAFIRYVCMPHLSHDTELPATGKPSEFVMHEFDNEVRKLSAATKRSSPGVIFLYPRLVDLIDAIKGIEWLPERSDIERIAHNSNLIVIDVSKDPEWTENLYRDGTHPNDKGNEVLAKILARAIMRVWAS